MEQDVFQSEIGGDGMFMNADGLVDAAAPLPPTGAAVVTPTGGAPVAGMETAPSTGMGSPMPVDKSAKLASAVADNKARLAQISEWSTRNVANAGKVNAKIESIKSVIAQYEARLAGLGGADVNSANPNVQRLSAGLARAKAQLANKEAQLAKVMENRAKIDRFQANQTARTAKLAAMSSADGDFFENADGDDYESFDGMKAIKSIDKKSLLIGAILGAGLLYLAIKYKAVKTI